MLVDPHIRYLFTLTDWAPEDVTPFQGFAPGLMQHIRGFQALVGLPGDVFEYTLPRADRLARRAGGVGGWRWLPFNASNLPELEIPAAAPLWVVFSADRKVSTAVDAWIRKQAIRPLHVGPNGEGAVPLAGLSVSVLAEHCRASLLSAKSAEPGLEIEGCFQAIEAWHAPAAAPSPLSWESHNVTVPNEMVLLSEGFAKSTGKKFPGEGREAALVEAVEESAAHVRRLRAEGGEPLAFRADPPRQDLVMFAPALHRGLEEAFGPATEKVPGLREAVRLMRRQRGYAFETGDASLLSNPVVRAALQLRGLELRIQAAAIGLRAASTVAATIRLPAGVNRVAGAVAHLSAHLRHRGGPRPVKTARVFRTVQDALAQAVGPSLMDTVRTSKVGIKLFADAPLEWLPVDGLPLGVRFDTSRIAATPGNLVLGELPSPETLYLQPDDFLNFLVVSSFGDEDHIRDHLRGGIEALAGTAGSRFRGETKEVRTTAEFVDALNSFDGPMAIIDAHGEHRGDVGVLNIGDERLDAWSLRTKVRMPPIVILSACDTHAADRSHATVANGLLHCGARAVLATMLPVRADAAAVMVARLLLRAVDYTRASNGAGRAVPWTHVVGGLLRMQLASEIIHKLVSRGLIGASDAVDLQVRTNMRLNPLDPGWYEWLGSACRAAAGLDQEGWERHAADVIAASDVIRYTHLGNPESIVVSSPGLAERLRREAQHAEDSS